MQTILDSAFEPGGAVRSRLIIPADELQSSAESVFKAAAQVAAGESEKGDLPLFDHLSTIARAKGFQHSSVILSLVLQAGSSHCVRSLIQDAIACMGGPGDFFDALDLITAPEAGRAQ
jgi:hypothetical protein